jgi:hypothetical protein
LPPQEDTMGCAMLPVDLWFVLLNGMRDGGGKKDNFVKKKDNQPCRVVVVANRNASANAAYRARTRAPGRDLRARAGAATGDAPLCLQRPCIRAGTCLHACATEDVPPLLGRDQSAAAGGSGRKSAREPGSGGLGTGTPGGSEGGVREMKRSAARQIFKEFGFHGRQFGRQKFWHLLILSAV